MHDETPDTLPAPAPPVFGPEEPTGVVCLACGALAQKLVSSGVRNDCPHCTDGVMTPEQIRSWKERPR